MSDWFFYGPLAHPGHLETLLGRAVTVAPADLPDHSLHQIAGGPFANLQADTGATATGVLARGLSPADEARLDFFEGGRGLAPVGVTVATATGPIPALTWADPPGSHPPGAPWDAAGWARVWFATADATMADAMALYGRRPGPAVMGRYTQMLVRGSSRVRARQAAPTTLRHAAGPGDVRVADWRQPYANYFAVEEADLSFRRFDGSMSPVVTRAAFISGDAVTVLPYDPVRDRVLLVEQFRAGPHARGDSQPWQAEAIAGRIDAGETPEQAARREAVEEAGLVLDALIPVANYYPSTGSKAEFLYSYVALVDLPDGAAGIFGMEEEAEDIRGHLVPFARMMELVASGEIGNAPLIITALWLERERPRLRTAAPPGRTKA